MSRVDFDEASWFPVDLHVPERWFGFARIAPDVVERSSFLDTRIEASIGVLERVPVDQLPVLPPPARVGWLFHTSFCGSTLLARALHGTARTVLREPLVLRRLGDARRGGWSVDGLVDPAVRLLGRSWSEDGRVVIKPTHAALNVGRELLDAAPATRGVILTSSLDDFLISNIKKTPETHAKVPELAERALNASPFGARLPRAAFAAPDLLEAVALQWAAQREVCAELLNHAGDRLRTLDAADLYAHPGEIAVATAVWLGDAPDAAAIRQRAAQVASRNAKAMDVAYDAAVRAREAAAIAQHYARELDAARAWFDQHVAPHMSDAARNLGSRSPLTAAAST
ncbi:hypothetical protein DWG18_02940 [Lysobacter sp. TY2-98]|uniref:hypothetical protein n=1 Tax=Lysobacter sp. TY2-98 TaxID=2290922 RepID=UPI000E1FCA98|nr:hypothetical protein [Lysobacter sp. TY2-98]AXK71347.1 hypothetical protein DWG18_02940 [Lysobacter sp. TY2-98]